MILKEKFSLITDCKFSLTDNAKLFKEATTLANEAHKTADDAYDAAQKVPIILWSSFYWDFCRQAPTQRM